MKTFEEIFAETRPGCNKWEFLCCISFADLLRLADAIEGMTVGDMNEFYEMACGCAAIEPPPPPNGNKNGPPPPPPEIRDCALRILQWACDGKDNLLTLSALMGTLVTPDSAWIGSVKAGVDALLAACEDTSLTEQAVAAFCEGLSTLSSRSDIPVTLQAGFVVLFSTFGGDDSTAFLECCGQDPLVIMEGGPSRQKMTNLPSSSISITPSGAPTVSWKPPLMPSAGNTSSQIAAGIRSLATARLRRWRS